MREGPLAMTDFTLAMVVIGALRQVDAEAPSLACRPHGDGEDGCLSLSSSMLNESEGAKVTVDTLLLTELVTTARSEAESG